MPTMRIRGVGQVGVNKDVPPYDLQPNAWSDSMNVRFRYNAVEKFGGCISTQPDKMIYGDPLAVVQRSNTGSLIYGTGNYLVRVEGSSHEVISKKIVNSTDFYQYTASPESTWYYTSLSNSIIMNTPLENPQGLRPFDTNFSDLPGWGKPDGLDYINNEGNPVTTREVDWKCGRVRSYRNYLIALSMTEDGVEMPQRVRWSNVSYVNDLPPDWQENDKNKDGGFNDLTDAIGKIVDGCPLRDSFVVYTDKETYLMDYVGGTFVFNFRKLFSDSGLLAPECVAEFEGKHFVLAQDDIFVHNGSSREPIASSRVKEFLIREISSVNSQATKVFPSPTSKEIWVCYVSPGSEPGSWATNKAAVWNWEYNTWYFYQLPNLYDVNMALPLDEDARKWEDFDKPEDYWDSATMENGRWTEYGKDFIKRVIYGASKDGCMYLLDTGENIEVYDKTTGITESKPIVAYLERTHLDMDEVAESTRLYKFITQVVPQFRGTGSVTVFMGGSENSTNPPTWEESQIYDIEGDLKVDCYSNNRYPAIKFVDFGTGKWFLSGYDLEFKVEGNR